MEEERVDDEIQQVVNEMLGLPHDILLRHLTYWSADIDNGEYGMDSELAREEWYEDCCNYASAETEQERYMYAGCMALRMGRMLQDIKHRHPGLLAAAMRAVKSRMNNRCVVLLPTMREEIEETWIEPVTWEDGRAAGMGYAHLVQTFMRQYEQGKMKEAAGNTLYLLERIGRLWFNKPGLFDPDSRCRSSSYELLMEAACHILVSITKDKRTMASLRDDIPWHLRTINMIYRRVFESFDTRFDNLMYWEVGKDAFASGYEYLARAYLGCLLRF